jgi:hypothetical protein
MNTFDLFFDDYEVKKGPIITAKYRNIIGRIIFYPSIKNPFVENKSTVLIYDDSEIFFDENIEKLLRFLSMKDEFVRYCLSIFIKKSSNGYNYWYIGPKDYIEYDEYYEF